MRYSTIMLLAILTLGFLAGPLAPDAQTPPHIPHLGIIEDSPFWGVFRQRLRELGYVEGQNIAIEWRLAEGKRDRLTEVATELVHRKMDILVTLGTPATRAAIQATATIPIVMLSGDPLRAGLVASLAQPGGNVTGVSILGPELSGKQLQILREAVPTVSRVAYLWNPTNPVQRLYFDDMQAGVRALGMTLSSVEVSSPTEFQSALAAMMRERPDALFMTGDPMHQLHFGQIIAFATAHRLPLMSNHKEHVLGGALMSYGSSTHENFRRLAWYVDKIVKGAKPGELPVEQPTKFELVINLKTAQALGLTIPPTLLFQAEEVIQ